MHNKIVMNLTQQSVNLLFKHYREGLIPGPQVPPRNPQETSPGSHGDRVLSVSGKKRCSHCKEELGKSISLFMDAFLNYGIILFVALIGLINNMLFIFTRPRSCNDHRKFEIILPSTMLSMLCLPSTIRQRRKRNRRESEE